MYRTDSKEEILGYIVSMPDLRLLHQDGLQGTVKPTSVYNSSSFQPTVKPRRAHVKTFVYYIINIYATAFGTRLSFSKKDIFCTWLYASASVLVILFRQFSFVPSDSSLRHLLRSIFFLAVFFCYICTFT